MRSERTAPIQKMACQSKVCATNADRGRPIAPPTPRVALIAAMAVLAISGGVTSRTRAMPTGMKPSAKPCSVRPTSIGARESDIAEITDPSTSRDEVATSTRCLPSRSPSRPLITIETAPASSVIVTTQPALDGEVPSRVGSWPWIGTTSVWVSETVMPPKQSTMTVISGRLTGGAEVVVVDMDMYGTHRSGRCAGSGMICAQAHARRRPTRPHDGDATEGR